MTDKKTAKSSPTTAKDSPGGAASSAPTEDRSEELAELARQLQEASQERDEYKDQLLRTMADFQNFRKRMRDEQRQIELRANERLIVDLLPILDNFERAIAVAEAGNSHEALLEGVRAIDRQFKSVLEAQKVRRVESVGQPFDPEHHDALALVESTEHEEGTVLEEVESGYKIGERVIRPARVRVSKKP
jgi:molecular chaperone GrpE